MNHLFIYLFAGLAGGGTLSL